MLVDLLRVKSFVVIKHLPAGVVRNFEKELPAQASSSSSDKKLR
ncbi:hypothetical protein AVEN_62543-1, partial [Araneus ventricosus]